MNTAAYRADTSPTRSSPTVFVVVGNPGCPRVAGFQAALARCELPPAVPLSYADLIAGRDSLERHVAAGSIVRLESPGRDWEVEKLLLAAGAKDQRFALPNARIMVHQPSGGFQGQATDIMLHAQEILNLKKRLNEIYVKHTGQSLKKIEDALERDYFLTAEAARDFGLVDKVIDKRPEELSPKPA